MHLVRICRKHKAPKRVGESHVLVEERAPNSLPLTQDEVDRFSGCNGVLLIRPSVDTPNPATSGHLKTGHHESGRDVFIPGLTRC